MTQVLTDLPAGHAFAPIRFTVTPEAAATYREAVGAAALPQTAGLVPPLAVAALALGALLKEVTLPAGTLHASEAVEFRRPVPAGDELECRARLAQRSVRGGCVVSVLDSDIVLADEVAVSARATVLSPSAGSS